jgi:hypothetical protein
MKTQSKHCIMHWPENVQKFISSQCSTDVACMRAPLPSLKSELICTAWEAEKVMQPGRNCFDKDVYFVSVKQNDTSGALDLIQEEITAH